MTCRMDPITLSLVAFLSSGSFAVALDMDECRPYATQATQVVIDGLNSRSTSTMKWLWNRFYTKCLLVEGELPDPPRTWQNGMLLALGVGDEPVFDNDIIVEVKPPRTTQDVSLSSAGAAQAAWIKWCKRHYRSFNPKDGTVIRRKGAKRVKCPH